MTQNPDLIIPVYLNQRLVFDLVAMLQGGIATVTRVSEAERERERSSGELTGGFGLSQAFSSLLKVNLSGKVVTQGDAGTERTSSTERVHTPASLLFTLRTLLTEQGLMRSHSGNHRVSPGEFIEFTGALRRNPLIEALDSIDEILNLVLLFQDPPKGQQGNKKGSHQGQPDLQRLKSQLQGVAESLKAGGTQDLVAELVDSGERALLTVEQQALSDPSLSDLVDGTFRVMGKVTRVIPNSTSSVSLLRKTAMSKVPPSDASDVDCRIWQSPEGARIRYAGDGSRNTRPRVPRASCRDFLLNGRQSWIFQSNIGYLLHRAASLT